MKVVIMAGGKGTRISSIAPNIPKPMIKIGNMPILEHEINNLKNQGYTDIIITVGYLGNTIIDYFKDGKSFGVNIEYYYEKEPLGNAGALFKIKDKLSDDFFLINGDVIFDIDLNRMVKYHRCKNSFATLLTHPNNHPYDSGLIFVDSNNCIIKWLNKEDNRPNYYKNRVNAGIHILSKKVLDRNINNVTIDLDRDILKPLATTGTMYAYDSPEYVHDMGTPERLISVENDYKNGLISKRNLKNKQKAIFLDRDGTLNKYVGFLTNIDELTLIDGVAKAISKINSSEYLAIVITNQPVIARGEITFSQLHEIHNKLETLLGKEGAYLDDIYFCPHHPNCGFDGEIKEFKIDCNCRKPKPGLILKAAQDYNIDLTQSWMIGDSLVDVECGINAGCKTGLIGNYDKATINAKSLEEIIDIILGEEK